jgi:hypothetical protein
VLSRIADPFAFHPSASNATPRRSGLDGEPDHLGHLAPAGSDRADLIPILTFVFGEAA